MYILGRRVGDGVIIGDNIIVKIVRIEGNKIRIGIDAPRDIPVYREEVQKKIQQTQAKRRKKESRDSDSEK